MVLFNENPFDRGLVADQRDDNIAVFRNRRFFDNHDIVIENMERQADGLSG